MIAKRTDTITRENIALANLSRINHGQEPFSSPEDVVYEIIGRGDRKVGINLSKRRHIDRCLKLMTSREEAVA